MNKYLLPALVTLLMAPLAQPDYTIQVPLTLEGEGPWYRLELPLSLQMAARHTDLRDLRVLNAEGEELAYALTLGSAQSEEKRQEAAGKWFPLRGPAHSQAVPPIRVQRSTRRTLVGGAREQGKRPTSCHLLDPRTFAFEAGGRFGKIRRWPDRRPGSRGGLGRRRSRTRWPRG